MQPSFPAIALYIINQRVQKVIFWLFFFHFRLLKRSLDTSSVDTNEAKCQFRNAK